MNCDSNMLLIGISGNCLLQLGLCSPPVDVTYSNRKPGDLPFIAAMLQFLGFNLTTAY